MFGFKSEKTVHYEKNRVSYRIRMEGLDDEEEVRIIKSLLKPLSVNRKVFMDICGDTSAIDKKAVIRMESDSENQFAAKLEISPERIEDINISELLENMWTNIYFFDGSADWKDFVERKKVHLHFGQGDLAAAIYLRNLDGIGIEIGEKYNYHMDEVFEQLQKEDIVLKGKSRRRKWNS